MDDANRERELLLLHRAAGRDATAFRELVETLLPMVLAVARRMLADEGEAEDVAQEAMLRLWDQAPTLDEGANGARAWVRRVTSNLCVDRLRVRKRYDVQAEVPEQAEQPTQLAGLVDRALAQRVEQALLGLPDRQRAALTLFHYDGHSQIEIGEILGVSQEAVESLLARARRNLRAVLQEDWRQLLYEAD